MPAARIAISVLPIVDRTWTSPRNRNSRPAITRKARSSHAVIGSFSDDRDLAVGQLRHDAPALRARHTRPAGDLLDRAPAAAAQARCAIDLADVDARALHSGSGRLIRAGATGSRHERS